MTTPSLPISDTQRRQLEAYLTLTHAMAYLDYVYPDENPPGWGLLYDCRASVAGLIACLFAFEYERQLFKKADAA
jgi:hypothetical protein